MSPSTYLEPTPRTARASKRASRLVRALRARGLAGGDRPVGDLARVAEGKRAESMMQPLPAVADRALPNAGVERLGDAAMDAPHEAAIERAIDGLAHELVAEDPAVRSLLDEETRCGRLRRARADVAPGRRR